LPSKPPEVLAPSEQVKNKTWLFGYFRIETGIAAMKRQHIVLPFGESTVSSCFFDEIRVSSTAWHSGS